MKRLKGVFCCRTRGKNSRRHAVFKRHHLHNAGQFLHERLHGAFAVQKTLPQGGYMLVAADPERRFQQMRVIQARMIRCDFRRAVYVRRNLMERSACVRQYILRLLLLQGGQGGAVLRVKRFVVQNLLRRLCVCRIRLKRRVIRQKRQFRIIRLIVQQVGQQRRGAVNRLAVGEIEGIAVQREARVCLVGGQGAKAAGFAGIRIQQGEAGFIDAAYGRIAYAPFSPGRSSAFAASGMNRGG